jgi:hypothetical protein
MVCVCDRGSADLRRRCQLPACFRTSADGGPRLRTCFRTFADGGPRLRTCCRTFAGGGPRLRTCCRTFADDGPQLRTCCRTFADDGPQLRTCFRAFADDALQLTACFRISAGAGPQGQSARRAGVAPEVAKCSELLSAYALIWSAAAVPPLCVSEPIAAARPPHSRSARRAEASGGSRAAPLCGVDSAAVRPPNRGDLTNREIRLTLIGPEGGITRR